jgi:hypothetical protein
MLLHYLTFPSRFNEVLRRTLALDFKAGCILDVIWLAHALAVVQLRVVGIRAGLHNIQNGKLFA